MALEQELTHTHGQFTANSGPIPDLSAPMFNVMRSHEATYNNSSGFDSGYWNISYISAHQGLHASTASTITLAMWCSFGLLHLWHFEHGVRQLPSRSYNQSLPDGHKLEAKCINSQ
jgi:hypothetical protein